MEKKVFGSGDIDVSTGNVNVGTSFVMKPEDIFDDVRALLYPADMRNEKTDGIHIYHTGITKVLQWNSFDWKYDVLESKVYLDPVHWELDCRYVQGYWIKINVDSIYEFIRKYPFLKIYMTGCHLCWVYPVYGRPEDIMDVVDKVIKIFSSVVAGRKPTVGRNPSKKVEVSPVTVSNLSERGEISLTVDGIDDTDPVIRKELKRVCDYADNNYKKYRCFDLYCNGLRTILV